MNAPAAEAAGGVQRASGGAAETERIAESLAPHLRVGDVIVLEGPLGAGKTRFVTGLARGADVAGRVRSPSFTLVNEYAGRIPLLHLDLYRLAPEDDAGLGLDELHERGALVVEWGERLPSHLRDEALRIQFAITGAETRSLTVNADAGRGRELLAAWRATGGLS